MTRQSEIIVGLFARGREIGYAVLERGALARYGVKSVKGPLRGAAFSEQVRAALLSLVVASDALIVTERPLAASKLGASCAEVCRLLRRRENVRALSVSEAKRHICGNGKATHRGLAEAVVERYPILRSYWTDNSQRAKYWERMLIAVAFVDTVNSY